MTLLFRSFELCSGVRTFVLALASWHGFPGRHIESPVAGKGLKQSDVEAEKAFGERSFIAEALFEV